MCHANQFYELEPFFCTRLINNAILLSRGKKKSFNTTATKVFALTFLVCSVGIADRHFTFIFVVVNAVGREMDLAKQTGTKS